MLCFMTLDYAGWADKIKGDSFPPNDGFYKIVTQEPLGVCAGVTAWNGSLHFLAWKAAPALACGNTEIVKPSEKSPLGTMAVAYLIAAAGFPPGVFQILPGEIFRHVVQENHFLLCATYYFRSSTSNNCLRQS